MVFRILRALATSVRRDLKTYAALKTNNFFLFVALMIYGALVSGVKPVSAEPFLLLLGVLTLFPISSDPLQKIPAIRLALWPLHGRQRAMLRLASLAFSPVLWLVTALLIARAAYSLALLLVATAMGVQLLRLPAWSAMRPALRVPGRLGGLIGIHLRALLTVLDLYLALLLCLGGTIWRLVDRSADPAAFPILAMLVALSLSTCAQCPMALEAGSGVTRYQLLPLRGWEILAAQDTAFLGVLLVLVLPLDGRAGLAFGFAALAIGRYPALRLHLPQQRWRFTSGRVLYGAAQSVVGFALGFWVGEFGYVPLAVALGMYLASLYLGGRAWERMQVS